MAASGLIKLSGQIDDAKCFAFVRQHRWLEGVRCPACGSGAVIPAEPEVCAGTDATTSSLAGSGIAARHAPGVSTTSPARCWPGTASRCGCGCCASASWA